MRTVVLNSAPFQDADHRQPCAPRPAADTNQTRVVKKVVPTDSFFSFFNPPQPPKPDDDDGEASIASDLDEKLELDYQIGEDLKERVVPRAIDYFTGKALRYEHPGGGEFDSDEFDDEFDEDDEERCGMAPP